MNNTDWQRPVTADGELDVRIGDVWRVKNGPPWTAEVMALPRGMPQEIACWADGYGVQVTTVHELGTLVERNGILWNVPEDKRKGQWVQAWERNFASHPIYIPGVKFDPKDRAADCDGSAMIWAPDAATPAEPATPEAPQPGERWEDARMVYGAVTESFGAMLCTAPSGNPTQVTGAPTIPGFAGYYYPAHGCKASAIRSDGLRYRNPHTGKCSTRYSPGDEIVRPTHVCFVKEAE